MPKRVPNKKYTPGFKKLVVETMQKEKPSYWETAERFGIRHKRVQDWERIYLTEGPEGFAIGRRGHGVSRPRVSLRGMPNSGWSGRGIPYAMPRALSRIRIR